MQAYVLKARHKGRMCKLDEGEAFSCKFESLQAFSCKLGGKKQSDPLSAMQVPTMEIGWSLEKVDMWMKSP